MRELHIYADMQNADMQFTPDSNAASTSAQLVPPHLPLTGRFS